MYGCPLRARLGVARERGVFNARRGREGQPFGGLRT